jgi:hypothetical protein
MARIHGRKGRLYVGLANSGATAEPVTFLNQWDIKFETDKEEVTAFGDTNKVYVSGLPDAQGSFAGFYDDTSAQLYTAASDGAARKFYLYPTTDSTSVYFFGTALFDFNVQGEVSGSVKVSGSWAAASAVAKVG